MNAPHVPTHCPECGHVLIKVILNQKYEFPCATCALRQLFIEQKVLEGKMQAKQPC